MLNLPYKFNSFIFLFFLLNSFAIRAQQDSFSIQNAKNEYQKAMFNEYKYIDGREYKPYHYPKKENPYLNQSSGKGIIYIEGSAYTIKKLIYDLKLDQLVFVPSLYKFSNTYIEINKARVDSFSIFFDKKKYTLTNLSFKNKTDKLSDGFYQILYENPNTLAFLKHIVIEGKKEGYPTYKYIVKKYVYTQGKYLDISSKKKLFQINKENKPKIRRKVKSFEKSYKKLTNEQFITLIKFIEIL